MRERAGIADLFGTEELAAMPTLPPNEAFTRLLIAELLKRWDVAAEFDPFKWQFHYGVITMPKHFFYPISIA